MSRAEETNVRLAAKVLLQRLIESWCRTGTMTPDPPHCAGRSWYSTLQILCGGELRQGAVHRNARQGIRTDARSGEQPPAVGDVVLRAVADAEFIGSVNVSVAKQDELLGLFPCISCNCEERSDVAIHGLTMFSELSLAKNISRTQKLRLFLVDFALILAKKEKKICRRLQDFMES